MGLLLLLLCADCVHETMENTSDKAVRLNKGRVRTSSEGHGSNQSFGILDQPQKQRWRRLTKALERL